jgi:hypothetical protein
MLTRILGLIAVNVVGLYIASPLRIWLLLPRPITERRATSFRTSAWSTSANFALNSQETLEAYLFESQLAKYLEGVKTHISQEMTNE